MNRKARVTLAVVIATFGTTAAAEDKPARRRRHARRPGGVAGQRLGRARFLLRRGIARSQDVHRAKGAGRLVLDDPRAGGNQRRGAALQRERPAAHQFAVKLISQDKKVLWNYDVPKGSEVHTACRSARTMCFTFKTAPSRLAGGQPRHGRNEPPVPAPGEEPQKHPRPVPPRPADAGGDGHGRPHGLGQGV